MGLGRWLVLGFQFLADDEWLLLLLVRLHLNSFDGLILLILFWNGSPTFGHATLPLIAGILDLLLSLGAFKLDPHPVIPELFSYLVVPLHELNKLLGLLPHLLLKEVVHILNFSPVVQHHRVDVLLILHP